MRPLPSPLREHPSLWRYATTLLLCAQLALMARSAHAQTTEAAPEGPADDVTTSAPVAETAAANGGKAPSQALEHYQRGREHYLAGRYREALEELRYALALDPDSPNLIYNVARVHEDLGNLDEAIANYQHYLEVLPATAREEREKTELTIRRLRGAKVEVTARRSDAPLKGFEETLPAPKPAIGRADQLFWTATGVGVALVAGGSVCGVLALQRNNEVADFMVGTDGSLRRRSSLVSQTKHFALASDLLFAGGAAALTGAALLFFLRHGSAQDNPRAPAASLYFDGRNAGVDLHGAF